MKINEAIKIMLESRSMKMPDLAKKLDVSPQAVSTYINGQKVKGEHVTTSVTVDTAVDIAAALDYEVVLVPKTRTGGLPQGSIIVDERATERKKRGVKK